MKLPKSFSVLVGELGRLPGVGKRTAMRLALFLLESKDSNAHELTKAINEAKQKVTYCKRCFAITDNTDSICNICSSHDRDRDRLCVVQSVSDLLAIEDAGFYDGLYHVLGGVISPLEGISEKNLTLNKLYSTLESDNIKEIVYALPSSVEADATLLIIKERVLQIKPDIKLSRVAIGLPIGGHLDYADDLTIIKAFENRTIDK